MKITDLDEGIIQELTFHGSQCTKDCSGHRAGYKWAAKKSATVKQNTPSNSFNNGTAIAIRRRNPTTGYVPPASVRGIGGKFQKFQPGKTT